MHSKTVLFEVTQDQVMTTEEESLMTVTGTHPDTISKFAQNNQSGFLFWHIRPGPVKLLKGLNCTSHRYSKVHQVSCNAQGADAYRCNKLVRVCFVCLYGKIIHQRQRVDYRTNNTLTIA